MFELTPAHLISIVGPTAMTKPGSAMRARQDNIMAATCEHINAFGQAFGLDKHVNLPRFIGQIAVESDYFKTTTEYASGGAYEGRKDLGNTQPGDGKRFRGHGLIQTTGRANHTLFNAWAHKALWPIIKTSIPDFVSNPDKLSEFPWAFWSAVYFWSSGNRTKKSLNVYAAENNDEMLTRIINGGTTHLDRRLDMTARAALILLGYNADKRGILDFQTDNKLEIDGVIGRKTRDALHRALVRADTDAAFKHIDDLPAPASKGPGILIPSAPLDHVVEKVATQAAEKAVEKVAAKSWGEIVSMIFRTIFRLK